MDSGIFVCEGKGRAGTGRQDSDFANDMEERTLGLLVSENTPVVVTALSILEVCERLTLRRGLESRSLSRGLTNDKRGENGMQLVAVLEDVCDFFEWRARRLKVGDSVSCCRREDMVCKEGIVSQ